MKHSLLYLYVILFVPINLSAQDCDFSKPNSRNASWSHDGSALLFDSNRSGTPHIYRMDADGKNTVQLTNDATSDYYAFYSPDDRYITYMAFRDTASVVRIMNADGTNNRALTPLQVFNADPSWSPDGKILLFYSHRDGNAELYRMDPDGSNQERITFTENLAETTPVFSPDGSKILFIGAKDGNADLYVMNPDGSGVQRLTDHPYSDRVARWAPDGKSIVFYSRPTTKMVGSSTESWNQSELVVIQPDGTGRLLLTDNTWLDQGPVISPDGTKIAYTSCKSGNREVWIMNYDGTAPRQITFTSR